jgi:tetratricopeptide (TPR) repeat protein
MAEALDPNAAAERALALSREATALRDAGRLDEAIARYREILVLSPGHVRTQFRLANTLRLKGDVVGAEQFFRSALAADPSSDGASVNLADLLDHEGRTDEAIATLDAAMKRGSTQPEVPNNLAVYLTQRHRHREAEAAYRRLVALRPDDPGARSALASCVQEQGRIEESVEIFYDALALRPDFPDALSNLGMVLISLGRLDAAEAACRRALAVDPLHGDATNTLAFALRERGNSKDAQKLWRALLERLPDHSGAQCNLALALLADGAYEEGWRRYEWRFRDVMAPALRPYAQPVWDGSALSNRTILLDVEQGFGDAIQFLRYATPLAAQGARVIAEAPRRLHRLLRTVPGVAALIDPKDPRPAFDVHAPLMSLPHLCGTTLETIPAAVPYLSAEPALVASWRARLEGLPRPWIGLSWQGNPNHRGDRWRSLPLAQLLPLAQRTGGTFVSLQKGHGSEQVAGAGFGPRLVDWSADMDTGDDALVDTAAIMASLDLVISVDTAIGHLAGALARPTALMLSVIADFRWLADRSDSPWYPTARLYRQVSRGDWPPVVAALGNALGSLDVR